MSDMGSRRLDRTRFRVARWTILLTVLAISTVIGLLHQKVPGLRIAGVDALCPFGGVEALWELISSGGYLKRIAFSSFALLAVAVLTNVLFGRAFCGQLCPLGTLQELAELLRRRLGIKRREVPRYLDVPGRLLKYLVLAVFTWLSWQTASLVIRPYDPWAAYHHLSSPELFTEFGVGVSVLGLSLAGSFVYDRFFCKYLCPMGAFLGLFSRLSFVRVTRHADACTDCGKCDRVCPSNIAVSQTAGAVSDAECIMCGECVTSCPATGALGLDSRGGVRLKPVAVAGATLGLAVALVAATAAAGRFELLRGSLAEQMGESAPAPAGVGVHEGDRRGEAPAVAAPASAEAAPFDVSLIRGYMTVAEVADATGIPDERFIEDLGIAQRDLAVPMKELKDSYPFDTQAVRDYVAAQLGTPSGAPSGGCE